MLISPPQTELTTILLSNWRSAQGQKSLHSSKFERSFKEKRRLAWKTQQSRGFCLFCQLNLSAICKFCIARQMSFIKTTFCRIVSSQPLNVHLCSVERRIIREVYDCASSRQSLHNSFQAGLRSSLLSNNEFFTQNNALLSRCKTEPIAQGTSRESHEVFCVDTNSKQVPRAGSDSGNFPTNLFGRREKSQESANMQRCESHPLQTLMMPRVIFNDDQDQFCCLSDRRSFSHSML